MKIANLASATLLEALRRYAGEFEAADRSPPVFAHFPGGSDPVFPFAPDSDRGLGALLMAAALYRPGGEALAARVVSGLYRRYELHLFKLNRLPFEPLQEAVAALVAPAGLESAERERIPGILRSVCDFFYRVGPLGAWLADAPDWEERAGMLCREIYWMGARSRTRTKARHFLWLACMIPGFGARHPQASSFDWPAGEGHMRFLFDVLRPPRGFRVPAPEERPAAFSALARAAFPGEPWRLHAPLEAFLRREGRDFACRAALGGCRNCALAPHCPAAARFLESEASAGRAE